MNDMTTDAGAGIAAAGQDTALSAELEKAAALLKSKGLDHAAAQLLAPEAETTKTARAPRKSKTVRAAPLKSVRKVKTKTKTVAKATAKKVAKAAKKVQRKATTGQSGPPIAELGLDDLNKKERLLVGCFDLEGERETRSIEQLGAEAFKHQPRKKQNSWARNSLRRLMRSAKWLEKTEPGKYRLTPWARTTLRAA
jgi:hypothetical protein